MRKNLIISSAVLLATLAAGAHEARAQFGSGGGGHGGSPPVVPSDTPAIQLDDFIGQVRNPAEALEMLDTVLDVTEYPDAAGTLFESGSMMLATFPVWDDSSGHKAYQGHVSYYFRGDVVELAILEQVKFDVDQSASANFRAATRQLPGFRVDALYDVASDGQVLDVDVSHSPLPETPVGANVAQCIFRCFFRYFLSFPWLGYYCLPFFGSPVVAFICPPIGPGGGIPTLLSCVVSAIINC